MPSNTVKFSKQNFVFYDNTLSGYYDLVQHLKIPLCKFKGIFYGWGTLEYWSVYKIGISATRTNFYIESIGFFVSVSIYNNRY
ncbi:hypothetical protein BG10_4951 [Bacillus thuringiensis serovar morrisoni]|nr:hypothetical protein BG10_4951 [Bacillus thuringiensis serovar morrisoni]